MKLSLQNSLVTALVVWLCACENMVPTGPAASAGASALPKPAEGASAGAPSSVAPPPPAAAKPTSLPMTGAAAGAAPVAGAIAGGAGAGAGGAGAAAGQAGSEPMDGGVQTDAATSADAAAPPEDFDPADLFPPLSTPETRTPSADNPAECPKTAPENPVGDCLGLPIYINCNYGTYSCVCDWYHWLCFG